MARITGVPADSAGTELQTAYHYTREGLKHLTGRDPEGALEPLQMYALIPTLLQGYGALEGATAQLDGVDRRYRALAELKAATLTSCEYCIDIGSQVSRQWGLTDEELLALPRYRSSDLFDAVDKLVLDYAVAMTRTPVEVTDELFDALRPHFDEAQLVELTHTVALGNLRSRFNKALGIGAAGFSEGMVCAIPAQAEPPAPAPTPV